MQWKYMGTLDLTPSQAQERIAIALERIADALEAQAFGEGEEPQGYGTLDD